MQTTLDKFYQKSRGPSSLRSKLSQKGPHDKLKEEPRDETQVTVPSPTIVEFNTKFEPVSETTLTDNLCTTPTKSYYVEPNDQLKSEPEDEVQITVPSQTVVECRSKSEPVSEISISDHLCTTPTKSHRIESSVDTEIEPLPSTSKCQTDNEIDAEISLRLLDEDEKNDKATEVEPLPSSSKCSADLEIVPKTPSSRLLGEDRCATPTRSPATQTVLRKQLRLGEYSRVLRDSKRTLSRKRTIDGSGDAGTSPTDIRRSMNDIYGSPKLRKCNMVEVEITSPAKRGTLKPRRLFDPSIVSSPKKNLSYVSPSKLLAEGPIRSPQPSPRKLNLERVDYLLAEGKEALVLPRKYLDLEETFHWIETIIKIRMSRKETISFNAIRNDVRKATGRRFTEEHLGQIKAIYPEAFKLSRQLVKVPMSREKSYELIIEIPNHTKSSEREKIFHDSLIERTKLHHQQFLEEYDSTLKISANEVKRWHREFNLNDVPDIEPIPLPKPPNTNEVALSAKDVLAKTHAIVSGNKRLERALSTISEEKTTSESQKPCQPASPACPVSPASPAIAKKAAARQKSLKGIPLGVLEKVRAKEAAKHAQDMTRTPAAAKEVIMLSRLPEIARILRVLFVKEKKSILPEELVLRVVGQSYKEKMSPKELLEHFELLSKHQPGWINSCKVENKPYIRLSKDADMTRVLGRLQKLIESS
ncbi:hypothetical protein V9T40_001769 [Parthenolecanium corni]|uniref:CDT1 Geminin-binding domain-containing protein n=1 Tax=Parthenolecanium corni TaxID=536013 RepID=A0AAN9TH65_9HEMI